MLQGEIEQQLKRGVENISDDRGSQPPCGFGVLKGVLRTVSLTVQVVGGATRRFGFLARPAGFWGFPGL